MAAYDDIRKTLRAEPRTWLITGVSGFIGSHLLEALLNLNQRVFGLDNFSTGHFKNLDQVKALVGDGAWNGFRLYEGDIRDFDMCRTACREVDIVLHHAALGSVPRSLEDPRSCHEINVTGFVNMLIAARDAGVGRFVFASSSAVYGDAPELPKVEDKIGRPLSPYAASKWMNEIYAEVLSRAGNPASIGLRYFNVFGPRQDPEGAYAAVIPRWIASLLAGEPVFINGDGETSRDFCYIENIIQANLLAGTTRNQEALNRIYNIAVGERTTLNQLFDFLKARLSAEDRRVTAVRPNYREFRTGDVRHSLADISRAKNLLGYRPEFRVQEGLDLAMAWYVRDARAATTAPGPVKQ
jgi:UDP-N-acetylglucosamine/UDP-N-acetylgalactosamine 4-epimerase